MKSNMCCHEILLITSSFSKLLLCKLHSNTKEQSLAPAEGLEEACWNGMLDKFLSGIIKDFNNKFFLWQIVQAKSFLSVEVGEYFKGREKQLSIDPYSFLPLMCYN